MSFPTVRDCREFRGPKRAILHDFDQFLRDAIARTELEAASLDINDSEIAMACVTVMMTVAADVALADSDDQANIDYKDFSRVVKEALTWAKGRLADRKKGRHSRSLHSGS